MKRPSARVAFKIQAHDRTRLRLLAWGEDDRVPNPGDMLIVADISVVGNNLMEMAVLIMGRDMQQLLPAVQEAHDLYEQNKDWLSQPVTREKGLEWRAG